MANKNGLMRRAMGRMAAPMIRMKVSKPMKSMLEMMSVTEDREYSCDDAYELLDLYADLAERGEDTTKLMPLVERHLDLCDNCREEFEVLLEAIKTTLS